MTAADRQQLPRWWELLIALVIPIFGIVMGIVQLTKRPQLGWTYIGVSLIGILGWVVIRNN